MLFQAIEGASLEHHVEAVSKEIPPSCIKYASRISNGRICLYLDNEEEINKLIATGFSLNGFFVEVRRLETTSRKVVLSNVSPELPDSVLMESLSPLGKVTSKLMPMAASLRSPNLQHIKSFRRSVFIQLTVKENTLPPSIPITFENRHYRIFLSFGDMTCFICKQTGHMKQNCPNLTTEPPQAATAPSSTENVTVHTTENASTSASPPSQTDATSILSSNQKTVKQSPEKQRQSSLPTDVMEICEPSSTPSMSTDLPSATPDPNPTTVTTTEDPQLTTTPTNEWPVLSVVKSPYVHLKRTSSLSSLKDVETKRRSKDTPSPSQPEQKPHFDLTTSQKEVLSPLDTAESPFTSTDFLNFIHETRHKQKVTAIALKYTSDINALAEILTNFLKVTTDEKLLKRLTVLQEKLLRSCS